MSSKPKGKPSSEMQELAKVLGSKPPKALGELPDADLRHLTEQIEQSLNYHQESVAQAEASIVNSAPRPLRGTIRRIFAA